MVSSPSRARPKTMPKRVQSKWETSRRSICTDLSLPARLFAVRQTVLEKKILFDHLLRHRGGRGSAMAAVFYQGCDRNHRVLGRRVGDEPGMVAKQVGELLALDIRTAHLRDLCRSGLSCNHHHIRLGTASGTRSAVNHIRKGTADMFQGILLQLQRTDLFRAVRSEEHTSELH